MFSDAGDAEKALEVFGKMGSGAFLRNMDTYNVLLSAYVCDEEGRGIRKLLLKMVNGGFMPRNFTFNQVLNGLLLTGSQVLREIFWECRAVVISFLVHLSCGMKIN